MTTLILVCLAYNPLSPDLYYEEMEIANAVKTQIESTLVLEEPKEEVKKVSTKKQTKKSNSGYDVTPDEGAEYRKGRIRYYCGVHGLSEGQCNTAIRIAKAESSYKPCAKYGYKGNVCSVDENKPVLVGYDKNGKPIYSTAAGLFMFTGTRHRYKRYHKGASKYNGDANIDLALWIIKNKGTRDRNASSHNW